MKILYQAQIRPEVTAIIGHEVFKLEMPSARVFAVPHRDWFTDEFFPFWCKWKTSLGLEEGGIYQRGSGMCEWITREMLQRLAASLHKAEPGRDWNPCALEAHVMIPSGYSLNGVTDGGHAPALICVTTDKTPDETAPENREWLIVEAQAWKLSQLWTPLDEAVAAGVDVRDVID